MNHIFPPQAKDGRVQAVVEEKETEKAKEATESQVETGDRGKGPPDSKKPDAEGGSEGAVTLRTSTRASSIGKCSLEVEGTMFFPKPPKEFAERTPSENKEATKPVKASNGTNVVDASSASRAKPNLSSLQSASRVDFKGELMVYTRV